MVLRDEIRDARVRGAPWRRHQVLHLMDECRSATAAWGAWDVALRDAEADEHPARTAADGDAGRWACRVRDVRERDAILLLLMRLELCTPDAVRFAEQSCAEPEAGAVH